MFREDQFSSWHHGNSQNNNNNKEIHSEAILFSYRDMLSELQTEQKLISEVVNTAGSSTYHVKVGW